jgi:hypothetical protein
MVIASGNGGNATGTNGNGGSSGDLWLSLGNYGTPGSGGANGGYGSIYFGKQITTPILQLDTTSTLTFWDSTSNATLTQLTPATTSSGNGANAKNIVLTAASGQAASGVAHNGGNGGNIVLNAGSGGTSGSATAGAAGYVKFGSGTVYPTNTQTSSYTLTYADYHIFANFSSGANLTLPAPVNGLTFEIWDLSGTAETNNITLVRNGSEKINGIAASRILQTNFGHYTIVSNGTDWLISG